MPGLEASKPGESGQDGCKFEIDYKQSVVGWFKWLCDDTKALVRVMAVRGFYERKC